MQNKVYNVGHWLIYEIRSYQFRNLSSILYFTFLFSRDVMYDKNISK